MCTVSFVPTGNGQYILTTNRDEKPNRQALLPDTYSLKGEKLKAIYPKDTLKNGTWVVVGNNKTTVCLLNGAFKKHHHNPPYKVSRGKIPLLLLETNSVKAFVNNNKFEQIEPFTLVVVQDKQLFEFRWDGQNKYLVELDFKKPYLWASSTLYADDIILSKQKQFAQFLKTSPHPKQSEILNFHGLDNPLYGNLLNMPEVKTTSITSIKCSKDRCSMFYFDLLNNKETVHNLSF